MTTEAKIRALAQQDSGLLAFLNGTPFRWFDVQVPPRFLSDQLACVRIRRVSTSTMYVMTGLQPVTKPRFQVDSMHVNAETARALTDAVIAFFGTIDLVSNAQFDCPPTTPRQFPTYFSNRMMGLLPAPEPPVYVETIDVRLFALEA